MSSGPRPGRRSRPDLRVSDTERSQVADHLSKHYGDGRLNQTEFDERLDQAMRAKTHADLSGLLADLPDTPGQVAERQTRRRRYPRFLVLVLVVVLAAIAGRALMHSLFAMFWLPVWPWLLIGLLAVLWFFRGARRHGRW